MDNNFKLISDENNKISLTIIETKEINGEKVNVPIGDVFEVAITDNTWAYDSDNLNYGRVKYNTATNTIIWDLSDYLEQGGTTSTSFLSYQLTFNLKLQPNTVLTRGFNTDSPYYSVSTNDSTSSKDSYPYNDAGALTPEKSTDFPNAIRVYCQYEGAYAYINYDTTWSNDPVIATPENFQATTYSVTDEELTYESYYMNSANALFLPVATGSLNVYKKDDNEVALNGAELQVIDSDGNLMTFYQNANNALEYSYYDTTFYTETVVDNIVQSVPQNVTDKNGITIMFNRIAPAGSSALASIVEIPIGTYYIYESTYPIHANSNYEYTNSSKDTLVSVLCSDGITRLCHKVEVTANTTTSKTVHNAEMEVKSKIQGYKVDENNTGVQGARIGLFDSYPADATVPIATTYTNTSGMYVFPIRETGTYYIKEIEPPIGYQMVSKVITVNVTSTDEITQLTETLVNYRQAKIIVHVDSSDYEKENFKYSLAGTDSFADTSYEGTTDEDGLYTFYVDTKHNKYGPLYPYIGVYSYSISQTSAPHDYYIQPEFSLTSFEDSAPSYDSLTIGKLNPGDEIHVYVYNPSIRVKVNNYDGNDRVTPIVSTTKLNDVEYNTNENGTYTANEWFAYGDNTLVQTKVPEGYNLIAEPIGVTISSEDCKLSYDENGQRYYLYEYTLYNTKKLEIPLVGGNGRLMFTIISLIGLCFAGFMGVFYVYRKKKTT